MTDKKIIESKKFTRITPRPESIPSFTEKVQLGCGKTLYLTVGVLKNGKIFEVHAKLGKPGVCQGTFVDAMSRMITIALRTRVDPLIIIRELEDSLFCDKPTFNHGLLGKRASKSCADIIAAILKKHMEGGNK